MNKIVQKALSGFESLEKSFEQILEEYKTTIRNTRDVSNETLKSNAAIIQDYLNIITNNNE